MKTNIVLKSTDRNLFGVTVRQETKTQFLSVTDLQEACKGAERMGRTTHREDSINQRRSRAYILHTERARTDRCTI